MRNICIFSGSSHPALAKSISERLGVPLARCNLSKFSNKETNVEIKESVRDAEVYVVQSGCGNVNDNFIELLIMISACRIASAKKITAVIPCFPYARQPDATYKKTAPLSRVPLADMDKYSQLFEGKKTTASKSTLSIPDTHTENGPIDENIPSTPIHADKSPQPQGLDKSESSLSLDQDRSSRRVSTISLAQPRPAITTLVPEPHSVQVEPINPTSNNRSSYKHWTARSGTLIADMLTTAGADHIITMDLHDPQFQGFFDIPVDNLYSQPLLIKYIKEKVGNYRDAVIVSPDAGGAKRATVIADKLNMDFALIHKERRRNGSPACRAYPESQPSSAVLSPDTDMMLVGDVKGKVCILIDDIADTSYTISRAAGLLHESGATKIYALITHAIMSGDAVERVKSSRIDEVVVTNSVPQDEHVAKCKGKMTVIDVAPLFAEAIRRIHNGESVSFLFDEVAI